MRSASGQSQRASELASEGVLIWLQHVLAQAKAGVKESLVVFVRDVEVVKQIQQRCPVKRGELVKTRWELIFRVQSGTVAGH